MRHNDALTYVIYHVEVGTGVHEILDHREVFRRNHRVLPSYNARKST